MQGKVPMQVSSDGWVPASLTYIGEDCARRVLTVRPLSNHAHFNQQVRALALRDLARDPIVQLLEKWLKTELSCNSYRHLSSVPKVTTSNGHNVARRSHFGARNDGWRCVLHKVGLVLWGRPHLVQVRSDPDLDRLLPTSRWRQSHLQALMRFEQLPVGGSPA